MEIEKLSPAEQQRVMRFAKELAEIFRRVKKDAEKRQAENTPDKIKKKEMAEDVK
jgi:hypothetical protein